MTDPLTVAVGVGVCVSTAFSHRGLYLSFFSMMYPMMGDPPSESGGSHLRSTCVADQSSGTGADGASGVAIRRKKNKLKKEKVNLQNTTNKITFHNKTFKPITQACNLT